MTATSQIFKDLVVVELASVLAGPMVGRFFAELGATVHKIENPKTGDVTRSWKNPKEDPKAKTSAYFASANWGKQHHFLDLNQIEDKTKVKNLCAKADVVLVNFKPGNAAKFGLRFEDLSPANPRLVYGEITGFEKGNNRPAFDMVLQAEAGFLAMSGFPDQPYAKMPVALIDILAAHQLKEGLLIALMQRKKVAKPQKVSVSLIESAIASLANQASNYLNTGFVPQPMGSKHPNIAPYGDIFRCEGNPFLVAIGSDNQFEKFCQILNIFLYQKAEFKTNVDRVKNREVLNELLQKHIQTLSFDKLKKELLNFKIPFGEIKSMDEVMASPAAQNLMVEELVENAVLKSLKSIAFEIS